MPTRGMAVVNVEESRIPENNAIVYVVITLSTRSDFRCQLQGPHSAAMCNLLR